MKVITNTQLKQFAEALIENAKLNTGDFREGTLETACRNASNEAVETVANLLIDLLSDADSFFNQD